jgi:hypothetical protein
MVSGFVKDTGSWVAHQWQNRVLQLAVFAGVLFYVVANPAVFKFMERFLPSQISKKNQVLVHTVLFTLLVYVGTRFFFDPVLSQLGLL